MEICVEATVLSLHAAAFADIIRFVLVQVKTSADVGKVIHFYYVDPYRRCRSPVAARAKASVIDIWRVKSYCITHLCFQQALQTGIEVVAGSLCLPFPSRRDTSTVSSTGISYLFINIGAYCFIRLATEAKTHIVSLTG